MLRRQHKIVQFGSNYCNIHEKRKRKRKKNKSAVQYLIDEGELKIPIVIKLSKNYAKLLKTTMESLETLQMKIRK